MTPPTPDPKPTALRWMFVVIALAWVALIVLNWQR